MAKKDAPSIIPTLTQEMTQRAPKKGSVLFESNDPDTFLTSAYIMRRGMEKIGVKNLDEVKKIRITIETVE